MNEPTSPDGARPRDGRPPGPSVVTAPPEAARRGPRLPAHLGRARTSTVVLTLLFAGFFVLWLSVRPPTEATAGTAGTGGGAPVTHSTTQRTTTTPPPTEPSSTVPTTTPGQTTGTTTGTPSESSQQTSSRPAPGSGTSGGPASSASGAAPSTGSGPSPSGAPPTG